MNEVNDPNYKNDKSFVELYDEYMNAMTKIEKYLKDNNIDLKNISEAKKLF